MNHDSQIDSIFLQAYFGYPTILDQGIKRFPIPYLYQWVKACGHISVDNHSHSSRTRALREANRFLQSNDVFFLFPTSGVNPGGIHKHFSSSVYYLAKKHNATVIPVVIEYQPKELFLSQHVINKTKQFFDIAKSTSVKKIKAEVREPITIDSSLNENAFKKLALSNYS